MILKAKGEAEMRNHTLTTTQCAEFCDVAIRTVSSWVDKGHLRGYRLPGSKARRIPAASLVTFMVASGMTPPAELLELTSSDAQAEGVTKGKSKQTTLEPNEAQLRWLAAYAVSRIVEYNRDRRPKTPAMEVPTAEQLIARAEAETTIGSITLS